jgi:hypothetical protein
MGSPAKFLQHVPSRWTDARTIPHRGRDSPQPGQDGRLLVRYQILPAHPTADEM